MISSPLPQQHYPQIQQVTQALVEEASSGDDTLHLDIIHRYMPFPPFGLFCASYFFFLILPALSLHLYSLNGRFSSFAMFVVEFKIE